MIVVGEEYNIRREAEGEREKVAEREREGESK